LTQRKKLNIDREDKGGGGGRHIFPSPAIRQKIPVHSTHTLYEGSSENMYIEQRPSTTKFSKLEKTTIIKHLKDTKLKVVLVTNEK